MNPRYVLALGVLTVSTAALLIRLAGDAPALVIGAYRLTTASLVVLPLALARGELRGLGRSAVMSAVASGAFLAAHFGFWISSFEYTSVASSVLLVTTSPLLVALVSPLVTGDRPSARTLLGILIALTGSTAIAWGDAGIDPGSLFGNLLAVLGAVAVAGYYVIGRALRARLSLLAYVSLVYPAAALGLIGTALAFGHPLVGYSPATVLWMVLLGLGPQVVGHSSLNWVLKYMSATAVSTVVKAEPVIASVLVWLLLGEAPTVLQVTGGTVVLAGVYLALSGERRPQLAAAPEPDATP